MEINCKTKSKIISNNFNKFLLISVSIFFGIFGWAKNSMAASYTCTGTADQNGINAAIASAPSGGTVTVAPVPSCIFTDKVTLDKPGGIKLIFSGTTISGNVSEFFRIYPSSSVGDYRLSGFTVTGNASNAVIQVDKAFTSLRIDSIIDNSGSRFLVVGELSGIFDYVLYGAPDFNQKILVDNITKHNGQFLKVYGRSFLAWAEPDGWGTDDFVIIENCKLSYDTYPQGGMIDGESGAKIVLRYSDINNGWFTYHDFANSRWRGSRAFEVYNNKFTCANDTACAGLWPMSWRGGTGLFYNNTATGYGTMFFNEIFRTNYSSNYGQCSTTGTLTMCRDAYAHCQGGTNNGGLCYTPLNDPACTGGGTCSYTGCSAASDCKDYHGNNGSCIQIDGNGAGEYPCRDQQGRGQEDLATGIQSVMPAYFWGNYLNGVLSGFSTNDAYVQPNRDYCNHNPSSVCGTKTAWNYVARTCPDPRTSLIGSCNSVQYGTAGYNVQGNSDTTPPAAPSGLSVQ